MKTTASQLFELGLTVKGVSVEILVLRFWDFGIVNLVLQCKHEAQNM